MIDSKLCLHLKEGVGGPQSFVRKYSAFLKVNQIDFDYWPNINSSSKVLCSPCYPNIIQFFYLKLLYRFSHVSRLDGFFSLFKSVRSNREFCLRVVYNIIIYFQAIFSSSIVFQSEYLKRRYSWAFPFKVKHVIPNSYDPVLLAKYGNFIADRLKVHSPHSSGFFLLIIEGVIQGDFAINVLKSFKDIPVHVFGDSSKIPPIHCKSNNIYLHGSVPQSEMYQFVFDYIAEYNLFPIYICLEENAPCPNSLIETLSLGIPSFGLDDGSVPELNPCSIPFNVHFRTPSHVISGKILESFEFIASQYDSLSKSSSILARRSYSPDSLFPKYTHILYNNVY